MLCLLVSVHACPSPEAGRGRAGTSSEGHKKKHLVLPLELRKEEKVQPYDDSLVRGCPNFWLKTCLPRIFLTAEENKLMGSKKSSKARSSGDRTAIGFPVLPGCTREQLTCPS